MNNKEEYMEKAIMWAKKKKALSSIKANHEGYDTPASFKNTSTNEEIQVDISFVSQDGTKNYIEIALKDDNPTDLVTRWKLLSTMAAIKKGRFHLLVPKGHKMFTKKLIEQYNISALIHSL